MNQETIDDVGRLSTSGKSSTGKERVLNHVRDDLG